MILFRCEHAMHYCFECSLRNIRIIFWYFHHLTFVFYILWRVCIAQLTTQLASRNCEQPPITVNLRIGFHWQGKHNWTNIIYAYDKPVFLSSSKGDDYSIKILCNSNKWLYPVIIASEFLTKEHHKKKPMSYNIRIKQRISGFILLNQYMQVIINAHL